MKEEKFDPFVHHWLHEKIEQLQGKIHNLEKVINTHAECINRITEDNMKAGKKPYICPGCYGYGRILKQAAKDDFDAMLRAGLDTVKTCTPCEGKGIIWG